MTPEQLSRRLAARAARHPVLAPLRAIDRELGGSLWLVGGFPRDAAIGRRADDIDLLMTARAAATVAALRQTFGTDGFRFRKRGVTTWRFQFDGRGVDIVDASRRGLDEDLRRRDFTINAIAWSLSDGRLADPCGGLRDLRSKRLHPPREGIFDEDPLRAVRLARFVAELEGFKPSRSCEQHARAVADRLARASVERIRQELDKIAASRRAGAGWRMANRLGWVDRALPELAPMARCTAGAERPDVWEHTLLALEATEQLRRRRLPGADCLDDLDRRRLLHWALLLHDIAKPQTFRRLPDGRPSFHGHEVFGERQAQALLRRLCVPTKPRRRIAALIRLHLRPGHLADAPSLSGRALRRLARDAGEDLSLLLAHAAADALGSGASRGHARWTRLRRALAALAETARRMRQRPDRPLLGGAEVMHLLGLPSGPQVGRQLEALLDAQAAGTVGTAEEARAWLLQNPVS